MSLFVDVIEVLSDEVKKSFISVIEEEKKEQERPVRKLCETCSKYLSYGELRYDKMEDGISLLQKNGGTCNALFTLLMAVLYESLDEDATALEFFKKLSEFPEMASNRTALEDFTFIGRLVTINEKELLDEAVGIMIDRYSDESTISDSLSNLYLKYEQEEYLPVFQRQVLRAKERFPSVIHLEGLLGIISLKAKDYEQALACYLKIKDHVEQDHQNVLYHFNMASCWDSVADCYLKLGDAGKTIESCDTALTHDQEAEGDISLHHQILCRKAEAFLLMSHNEETLALVNELLGENPDDAAALEIKSRIPA
jgi:tetratricopeptide (TPR) repeat protein